MECFACGVPVEDTGTVLNLKLEKLCQILKLPVLIVNDEQETQFCGDCCEIIKDGEEICRQLEELEEKLVKVQEKLRVIISGNFVDMNNSNNFGDEVNNVESLIKKSFLEYWQQPPRKSFGNESEDLAGTVNELDLQDNIINCDEEFINEDSESQHSIHSVQNQDEELCTENETVGSSGASNSIERDVEALKIISFEIVSSSNYCSNESERPKRKSNHKQTSEDNVSSEAGNENDSTGAGNKCGSKRRKMALEAEGKVEVFEDKDDFKCAECNKRFKDDQGLAIHIKRAHEGDMKPYECLVCKWKFASPSKLQAHAQSRRHSQVPDAPASETLLDCPQCPQQFKDLVLLEAHVKGKHEGVDRPFDCTICGKTYKKRNHLHDHQRMAHGSERPFYCEWCDPSAKVSFSTQKKLDLHVLTVHQNNTCSICEKNFKTPYILNRHMNSHNNVGATVFICEICGAKYRALKRLKVHQMRHENKEPFSCEECGRVFSEPRTLQHHRDSVHENKFKYHCEICGVGCQQIYMLNRHMMCHSNEKKFNCEVCGLKFKRKQQLIIHERKHTGERPFKCRHCGKEFAEKKKLKNHEFVHGGEKPYQCSICSKQFALRHYLTHHINSYHKNPRKNKGRVVEEEAEEEEELQEITIDGGMILDQLDPKFVSVELIDEPHVVHEEVIAYDESSAQLEGGLVVGEWIQFGFVSND